MLVDDGSFIVNLCGDLLYLAIVCFCDENAFATGSGI